MQVLTHPVAMHANVHESTLVHAPPAAVQTCTAQWAKSKCRMTRPGHVPCLCLPLTLQLKMDSVIDGLGAAAGGCERLLGTPVPLRWAFESFAESALLTRYISLTVSDMCCRCALFLLGGAPLWQRASACALT